ncbi:MAG: polysaccharide biosynthesis protein [Chloroflexi bacterium]|nr:polysaccharide biosynthesis protein [Chloroflexota bacterium]
MAQGVTGFIERLRIRHWLALDAVLVAIAYFLSFAMRFPYPDIPFYFSLHWSLLFVAVPLTLGIFYAFGLYHRMWRYAGVDDLLALLIAVSASALALGVVVIVTLLLPGITWLDAFPRSIVLINWLVLLLLIGGSRMAVRVLADRGGRRPSAAPIRRRQVLIAGAGQAGAMLLREIRRNPHLGLTPIGFLDDDLAKRNQSIQGVPVLGTLDEVFVTVTRRQIDEVLIAMPTAPGKVLRRVVTACEEAGVPFKTIPGMYELAGGQVHASQMRDVRIEDLLRREAVQINIREIAEYLTTATVLVTGAGGSIGAELARKIVTFQPRHLVLLGHGENSIHRIEQELRRTHPRVPTTPIIADIKDATKIDAVMARFRPQVVFHAAAHKHVPLMETNVEEVVTNNILGTRIVAEAAHRFGVRRFVLISTDKAVNPANVLGASKRIAEMIVQDLARRSATAFVAVRFGNVLASQGSVVLTFQDQIAAGGPVTVTHPEMTRYFMTIPEAAQLVIQAGAMGEGGEIFVLDMGEPVRILDLAEDIIRLSGLEVGRDIDIKIIGLRRGEKLHEEVFSAEEAPAATSHAKILMARPAPVDGRQLSADIDTLARLAAVLDAAGIRDKFREMLPTYRETSLVLDAPADEALTSGEAAGRR